MLKIVQINLGRRAPAHDLLRQTIATNDIDIAIISEPNKNLAKRNIWYTDINSEAAICLTGSKKTSIQGWGQETGFVWIEFMEMTIYSCYMSPNIRLEEFEHTLNKLKNSIVTRNNNYLHCEINDVGLSNEGPQR